MITDNRCLGAALAAFPFQGKVSALKPFGSGHINDTYAVYIQHYPQPKIGYVLQRINTNVFKDPEKVMQNIVGVTEYIRGVLEAEHRDSERGTLHFLKTWDGKTAFYDPEGMPWRSYRFIENSFCYERCSTDDIFYQSARAFGDFLRMLEEYPADSLHETIEGFHHTPSRVQQFREALAEDKVGRAADCLREAEFVLGQAERCGLLCDLLDSGELPLRVTHNDTKLNNILFDNDTGKALCVIDLDTIMPGLSLNDFGDSIRFGATTATEDEQDLDKVHFSLPLFETYARGYLEAAGAALTSTEKELLAEGARMITLECGIRFLTDHLSGDTYFKIDRPNHNLDRCRTQFKLVSEMDSCFDEMRKTVARYC